ncbi:centrosomal protein of 152 kDa-like [Portunus trituberculatus]|uniref:centrosomal protein of 152 kDa-like n=1 Tax=Portunus trituberculatus TaxID=210409 RepID=UPI001E1CCAAE|nr:centrosomal protein of 152 kDa-like [Portunus trituberculatus]
MDNPGHSIFAGGSLHLDGIAARNEEEDLQREEEEEEENRRREKEIQDLLVNAFDDLEEEESYTQHSAYPFPGSAGGREDQGNVGSGRDGGGYGGMGSPMTSSYAPQAYHEDVHNYQEYQSDVYHQQNAHHMGGDLDGSSEGRGSLGGASCSSSNSVTPWSEDSRGTSPTRFSPLHGHLSTGSALDDATSGGDPYVPVGGQDFQASHVEVYATNDHHAGHFEVQDNQEMLNLDDQYKQAETSYDQLKLLYEVRGRELDRQMSEYSKLQFESNRDIRSLQHQLSLLRSENDGKSASVKQLQILLSEKEERTKALVTDMKELQSKLSATQDENKKLHLQLETAESTISSLECQVSELQAVDSLSRNQKLQEEFIRKLQQGNQEEKDLLLSKLHESEKEAHTSQQEVKRLREELKNMRNLYDGAVVQKSETVAKLNVMIETLRKQYEQLLQAHDSQETLKLELKVKSLEATNQNLEEQASMLDIELKKAKEDLKSFDMAMKLGIMKDILPTEDSMLGLGIKQALTYNDTTTSDTHKRSSGTKYEFPKDKDSIVTVREELKKSLMINKAKREEIALLRNDVQEKQDRIRKATSDLRDAHAEVKQLKEQLLRLQMKHDEKELREKDTSQLANNKERELQVENISLQQEMACLLACVRDSKVLYGNLMDAVMSVKDGVVHDQVSTLCAKMDELVHHIEAGRKLSAEVECLHEMLTEMRKENAALHQAQAVWENRIGNLEVKLKVSGKMIMRAVTDPEKASEITPSLATLQRLLADLQELVTEVNQEIQEANYEKLKLQDRLAKCNLDLEKMRDKIAKLEEEKVNLKGQFASLEKDKNKEKDAELECYQKTYLKFHEEAMHELEANVKVEYEQIVTDLKRKMHQLNEEIKETKDCYIQVCQEKNQLEERLEQLMRSRSTPIESQRLQQGARTALSTPDSGVCAEGVTQRDQVQEVMLHKEIETLKEELAFVKERYKEQSRKLEQEMDQAALPHKYRKEDTMMTGQGTSEAVQEMEETCSRLGSENKELREKYKDQEAEIMRLKEILSQESVSGIKGAWQAILERQQKRMDEEKKELRAYYGNIIEELQKRYTQIECTEISKGKMKEQESNINDKIRKQEDIITTLRAELEKARNEVHVEEEEREKEVRKLTNLLQNKEEEVQDKQEQNNVIRLGFQNYVRKVEAEHKSLQEKVEKLEAQQKEKDKKYIHLKLKFEKYNEVITQRKYYKSELNRLWDTYEGTKVSFIVQLQNVLEEVKVIFEKQVEAVKETLGALSGPQVAQALQELSQLSAYVKNFDLKIS